MLESQLAGLAAQLAALAAQLAGLGAPEGGGRRGSFRVAAVNGAGGP